MVPFWLWPLLCLPQVQEGHLGDTSAPGFLCCAVCLPACLPTLPAGAVASVPVLPAPLTATHSATPPVAVIALAAIGVAGTALAVKAVPRSPTPAALPLAVMAAPLTAGILSKLPSNLHSQLGCRPAPLPAASC